MSKLIDNTGLRFGRLIALRYSHIGPAGAHWLCQCDCGSTTITSSNHLRTGHTTSCGCVHLEALQRSQQPKHGHFRQQRQSPTYVSWRSMINRCTNPRAIGFQYWGGRGITVCERWLHSFEAFLEDMGERPEGKTLDRWPDPDGNYEPGNCRWSTAKEQRAHRSMWLAG
jgi:hypothetical protein